MCAPTLEHEPRARDEILDRVGYEDFPRASEPSDSGSDVNGDARELRPYDFALTRVISLTDPVGSTTARFTDAVGRRLPANGRGKACSLQPARRVCLSDVSA